MSFGICKHYFAESESRTLHNPYVMMVQKREHVQGLQKNIVELRIPSNLDPLFHSTNHRTF